MAERSSEVEQAIEGMLKQAHALTASGRAGEAEGLLQEALRELDARGLRVHPLRAYALHLLRSIYSQVGRLAEAAEVGAREVALLEEHFGPDHPRLGEPVEALAMVHYHGRQYETAEPLFQRALALFRRGGPPGEARSAFTLAALGKCYHRQDRMTDAAAAYRAAIQLFERQSPPGPALLDTLYHLGTAVARVGDPHQAEGLLTRALALFDQVPGPRFPLEFMVLTELVGIADALRQPAAAEQHARRAVALAEASAPPEHPAHSDALRHLARSLAAQGRQAEMQTVLERALPMAEKAYGPQSPVLGGILHNLAGSYYAAGQLDRAAALEERAVAIYEANASAVGPALPDSLRCLGKIRDRQGRPAEASELVARAQQLGYQPPVGDVLSVAIPQDQA